MGKMFNRGVLIRTAVKLSVNKALATSPDSIRADPEKIQLLF